MTKRMCIRDGTLWEVLEKHLGRKKQPSKICKGFFCSVRLLCHSLWNPLHQATQPAVDAIDNFAVEKHLKLPEAVPKEFQTDLGRVQEYLHYCFQVKHIHRFAVGFLNLKF